MGAVFIALAALAGIAIALFLPVDRTLRVALTLYVVARALDAHARLRQFVALSLRLDGHLELVRRDASVVEAQLRPGGVVTAWMATVRWRRAGARFDRSVLVLSDMLPKDSFRQLRILLRWA